MLQSVHQQAVKHSIWSSDLILHPAIALQVLDLMPEAVQSLQGDEAMIELPPLISLSHGQLLLTSSCK